MCSLHLNSSVEIMWMFRSRGSKRVCLIAEVSVKDLLRWWFTEEWWRIIEDHYAQQFLWAKRPNWLLLLSCTIWIMGKPLQGRPVEFMLCYNNCTILPAVSFGEITVIILQLWEISYLESVWTNNQLSRHVCEISTYAMEGRRGLTRENKIRAKLCRISGNFRALIEVLVYKKCKLLSLHILLAMYRERGFTARL